MFSSNVLYISHGIQRSFKIRVKFSWWFWHPVKSCDSYINIFYYSLIISCMFCANYKVRECFEFSREELGVKDEQQIDLRFQALRVLKFQAWRFSCAFIVDFSDLIRKMYVEKKTGLGILHGNQTSIVNEKIECSNMRLLSWEYTDFELQ